MSLLEKASIVTTPTAYGVGVLNSIKPAIPFGEELVTNGSFNNGSTGWTIINGTVTDKYNASMTAYQSGIRITPFSYTGTFKVVFDLVITSGNCKFDGGGGNDEIYTTSGTKEKIITNPTKFEFNAFNLGWVGSLDNVSVKEMIDADFDFTRTSSATRVNPDYLIETVSINSANLVQNGNFSELGSELVINGDFSNGDTDWTLVGTTTIGNGVCTFRDTGNTNSQLIQTGITANKTYKLVFDVTRYVSGRIQLIFGGGSTVNVDISGGVGTYTAYVLAGSSTNWLIKRDGGYPNYDFSINNVSVKQVDPNDNWTLGTGWSFGTNKAICDGSSTFSDITQSSSIGTNLKYKVTYTILDYVSGSVKVIMNNNSASGLERNANGTYSDIITSLSNDFSFRALGSGFNGSITNVSVIEIQENGVPRLDYTNGTASILLEPQSTNLIPYSSDYSQWISIDGVVVTDNFITSPDGTQNAAKLVFNGTTNSRIELNVTASGTNTQSVYLKTESGTQNVSIGASSTDLSQFTITDKWVRYSHTGGGNFPRILCSDAATIYAYGAQLEAQSFSTSLINTSGSTVTRAAETLNNAGNSDLINSTEGVLYAEISALADTDTINPNRGLGISSGSTNNTIFIYYQSSINALSCILISNGTTQFSYSTTSFNVDDYLKIALKYKQNDFALWVNGVEVVTDTIGNTPIGLNELAFDNGVGNDEFYGRCKTVAVFKEALSDTELACLTSTNNREIFLNYYYRMQYVGANTEALSCAEQTFNI